MRDLRELNHLRDRSAERSMGVLSDACDEWGGFFRMKIKTSKRPLAIIASRGDDPDYWTGWDHVSVSLPARCPTWDEMCLVKETFFLPTERALQLHPLESEYISNHRYCLHIWRPTDAEIAMPPALMVGIQSLGDLGDPAKRRAA